MYNICIIIILFKLYLFKKKKLFYRKKLYSVTNFNALCQVNALLDREITASGLFWIGEMIFHFFSILNK